MGTFVLIDHLGLNYTYEMDKHAEMEVSASGNKGFQCSDTALSFEGGTTVNLKSLRLIALAHLNSTNFPADQGE